MLALAWIAFITVLFSIPPNELAGWSIILMAVFMLIYWQVDAKRRFKGPTASDEAALRKIETDMAAAAHGHS